MNAGPKVSVCMITYNHAPFIRQAIESALMQKTNFEYEIVIGEDCSTDKTREIVCEIADKYPKKVVTNLQKKNVGPAENFLSTFAMCKGEYIAILEGDDYWTSPDKLQTQVDILDSKPNVAICTHAVKVACVEEGGESAWVPPVTADLKWVLLVGSAGATCSIMLRRLKNGLPAWFKDIWGDWIVQILSAEQGDIIGLQNCMGVYRRHKDGFSIFGRDKQRLINFFEFDVKRCNFLLGYFGKKYRKYIRQHISTYCNLNLAILYHQEGQYIPAIKNALAALSHLDVKHITFPALLRVLLVFVPFSRMIIKHAKLTLSKSKQ